MGSLSRIAAESNSGFADQLVSAVRVYDPAAHAALLAKEAEMFRNADQFTADGIYHPRYERLLDEAAEMGREQGLSLRCAFIPSGYSPEQRAVYVAAYEPAFSHAEAESMERDFDDSYDRWLDSLAYSDHSGAWGASID